MAQSVKRLTLDFGSGHDLTVRGFKPRIGLCVESEDPARDALSPSFSAHPLLSLSLSLSKNKLTNKKLLKLTQTLRVWEYLSWRSWRDLFEMQTARSVTPRLSVSGGLRLDP